MTADTSAVVFARTTASGRHGSASLSSRSMPALSPGSMVEFAWLSTFGSSRGTRGGYVHGRWFFETEDMPILLWLMSEVARLETGMF